MRYKLLLLCLLLMIFPLSSHAQFIGIKIGIPGMSVYGVGSGHGGGSSNPSLLLESSGYLLLESSGRINL